MSRNLLTRRLLIAIFAVLANPSDAAPDRSRFSIGGTVATLCRIDFDRPALPSSLAHVVDLGRYTLLCNSREGFRIVVQHPPNLPNAAIAIDGVAIPLTPGIETVLVVSKAPAFQSGAARLVLGDAMPRPIDIAFRVEPLGVVYQ